MVGMLNISLIEIQIQKAVKRQVTRDECFAECFNAFLVPKEFELDNRGYREKRALEFLCFPHNVLGYFQVFGCIDV